jgi:hypothetical protein
VTTLSKITNIPSSILLGGSLDDQSVAQRMSWAATRETTQVEDRAYSLLGIFGIHMPLLYDEGIKAFTRLQEEILKTSDDHTIFTWVDYSGAAGSLVLAPDPSFFKGCSSVPDTMATKRGTAAGTININNKGIYLTVPVSPKPPSCSSDGDFIAILPCINPASGRSIALCLSSIQAADISSSDMTHFRLSSSSRT